MTYPLMRNNIIRSDLDEVIKHLKKNDPILTNGPKVKEFEKLWSEWLGVKYSVFVNSGSSANLLSMAILKTYFPEGGEVIVSPLNWVSDIASVLQLGFDPVFVDINPETMGMDDNLVISNITDKTRAVFLTHIQGFSALTKNLLDTLQEKNIYLIEDVCEAHGAKHENKLLGSYGWLSNFSFYYAHHLSTIEGGMICTNSKKVYEIARMMRSHGMVRESSDENLRNSFTEKYPDLNPQFIFAYSAYNTRNTEIGAIIGINQLKRLNNNVKLRTRNLLRFLDQIDPTKFRTNFKTDGSSSYALNVILKHPDSELLKKITKALDAEKIEYRLGSAGGGNQLRQPYLRDKFPVDYFKKFPETEHIHFYCFYIGNFPDLNENEIDYLCSILNNA